MFETLTTQLLALAHVIPLELFTFVGSFVEEVIAPIPSPIVMTLTGSIASAQAKPMIYLLVLSLIGAAGKTIGAVLVYWIAHKAEELILGKFGKVIGVTHEDIERFGKKLKGNWRDIGLLLFLRALPIMSSAVVSVGSGILAVRMRVYIVSTFFGTIIRDFFYLYVGYTGITFLHDLVNGFDSIESILQIIIAGLVVLLIGYAYWKRKPKS